MEQFKKVTTAAKYVAVVLVFLATIGQAVYAAWFKPTGAEHADDVYAALRERIAVNERYFLSAVQEVAVLRAEVGALRVEIENSRKTTAALTSALKVPPFAPVKPAETAGTPAPPEGVIDITDESGFHIGVVGEMVQALKERGELPEAAPKR